MKCFAIALACVLGPLCYANSPDVLSPAESAKHPLPAQPIQNDTGINVLFDHSHQTAFLMQWDMPPVLRDAGLRVVGSQETLDLALKPGALSRARVPDGKRWPFGWVKNPRYNVVVTYQNDPSAQRYTAKEVAALKQFVKDGGGLVMVGGQVKEADLTRWPLAKMVKEFGVAFGGPVNCHEGGRFASVNAGPDWTAMEKEPGGVVAARRTYGKGRIVVMGSTFPFQSKNHKGYLENAVKWAAAGRAPVGGTTRLPMENGGAPGILPELETQVGNVTVYYSNNQLPKLLEAVKVEMPKVKKQVLAWFPSVTVGNRMTLILAAGDGGGWAVNAYEPQEVGVISLSAEGLLSIFAHEQTHNLFGPPNSKGKWAGELPYLFSETHAGWFQGKIEALRTGDRSGHNPNNVFQIDPDGTKLDLATIKDEDFPKGWSKLWWVFQQLDDRFGSTWYPRWMWVKNERWASQPNRQLTWDDVVDDMSIAVGEDLFPFFKAIGTTLTRDRFEGATFMGKKMELKPTTMKPGKAGEAKLGPIGDYKQPL